MKIKCDHCGRRFNKGDTNRYVCPHCRMLTVENYLSPNNDTTYHNNRHFAAHPNHQSNINYSVLQSLLNIINTN